MRTMTTQDLQQLAQRPLTARTIGEMIKASDSVRAKVELINRQTGEYSIVLQGTLKHEAPR